MKKWMLVLLSVLTIALIGCGNGENSGNGENDSTPAPTKGVTGSENKNNGKTEPAGYVFEYEGTKIWMDMDASLVVNALGEPDKYFEAPSCAFEGLDKKYTYGSIEIDTYEIDGKDYVSCVYFRDDLVNTPEGICLYMTMEDMVNAYGNGYKEEFGMYVYEKDGMKLKFLVKDNEITSIEYVSTVLDAQ
ncbi:MAG: hypothetical protein E7260_01770 [Lachnospiraceae bacterium]|nr:hypothetical protein [Lachnospiraceae bacterium]